jgi:hypothetical protein
MILRVSGVALVAQLLGKCIEIGCTLDHSCLGSVLVLQLAQQSQEQSPVGIVRSAMTPMVLIAYLVKKILGQWKRYVVTLDLRPRFLCSGLGCTLASSGSM